MKIPFTQENEELVPYKIDPYLEDLLHQYSSLLREFVHFGSHMLKWDVETSKEKTNTFLPTLYFRNCLELIDSISILIKNCSIDPAKLLSRSLFENNLNLLYSIEKDEGLRMACFLVWKIKNDIKSCKKYLSQEKSSKQLQAKIRKDLVDTDFDQYLDLDITKEEIIILGNTLKKPEYKDVAIEYERTKNKLRKSPSWYSLYDGPTNIENLAGHFQMNILYEFTYRHYSEFTHSTHVGKGISSIQGIKDEGQIIQIRDFQDSKSLTADTLNFALLGFNWFIKKRIPEHDPKYREWYLKFVKQKNEIMAKEMNYEK